MALSSRLLSRSKQLYSSQIILQHEHWVPVRSYAKEAAPTDLPPLKGDEMLKNIFYEVKDKFETAIGMLRKEKTTIDPNDPAVVSQYARVMKTIREKTSLYSESQKLQYTIQQQTQDIPDARTYLLALKEIRANEVEGNRRNEIEKLSSSDLTADYNLALPSMSMSSLPGAIRCFCNMSPKPLSDKRKEMYLGSTLFIRSIKTQSAHSPLTSPPPPSPPSTTAMTSPPSLATQPREKRKISEKRNIRDHKCRLLASQYELRRKLYKAFCKDPDLPYDMREKHRYKLSKLPRNSSFTRVRNRCIFTGRPRSVLELFRMSRIVFRSLASQGALMGIKKASW